MAGLARAWRWLWEPANARALPLHETWPCPVCSQPVEIETTPMAYRRLGLWLPPSSRELVAVCALQRGSHRRDGMPVSPTASPDPEGRWRPVELGPGPAEHRPMLVLVPPAGVVLVPDEQGAFDCVVLPHLEPADLVGSWATLIATGERVTTVAAD